MFNKFGNKVRVKSSAQTEEKKLAGKIGQVYGETTPSLMTFEIIGTPGEDYAVNVYFDDLQESFWFDAALLEQVDDGEGVVMTLDGVSKKWTKGKNAEWIEEETDIPQASDKSALRKRWWEFWRN